MPPNLNSLPNEVLGLVFAHVEAVDLGSLSKSCAVFNDFIKGNTLLYRQQYLKYFDHLDNASHSAKRGSHNWVSQLHRLIRLDKILSSKDIAYKRANISFVADAILDLIDSTDPSTDKPLNRAFLLRHFEDTTASRPPTTRIVLNAQNGMIISSVIATDNVSGHQPPPPADHPPALNVQAFLTSSSLFTDAGSSTTHVPASTEAERQQSARLHVLYGDPIDFDSHRASPFSSPASSPRSSTSSFNADSLRPTHPYARAKVYDLRQYTTATRWGPFKASTDASMEVDWEKVEAIMVVLGFNMRLMELRTSGAIEYEWRAPFHGLAANSFRPRSSYANFPSLQPRRDTSLVKADPYNVTGTWMRVVCFLDYSDLYAFNFAGPQPEDHEVRRPIDTEEATRMIILTLVVVEITDAEESRGEKEGTKVVRYVGTSRSMHDNWDPNANSSLRGTVRTLKNGHVSWTSFSVFHGEERWRSEAIQVGGINSARGVFGTWFDKDFDPEGPAGPTAYWKLSDKIGKNDLHLQGPEPASL